MRAFELGVARTRSSRRSPPPPPQAELFFFQEETAPAEPESFAPALPQQAPKPPAAAVSERRIWTVRSLVTSVRQQVESAYTDIWVEGEISNCRPAASGHIYFTLKDGEAQLPVVLFRRQATLLRFRPADGLSVLVRGRISVYESRGQLQLIAETMEPRGAGSLQLAFEQLKARLLAEGLFDADRKRPLPAFPHCVGIVTSPTGAVIRDIVNVVRRRHARLNLLVYPATMQGSSSPGSVAAGVRWFNKNPSLVDVIILARGGGSMEDLSGFNDEALARVIAASEIPIVSAIGHETDFTIADFVADLRAPTPSAAAELVTAAQHRVEDRSPRARSPRPPRWPLPSDACPPALCTAFCGVRACSSARRRQPSRPAHRRATLPPRSLLGSPTPHLGASTWRACRPPAPSRSFPSHRHDAAPPAAIYASACTAAQHSLSPTGRPASIAQRRGLNLSLP